MSEKRGEWMRGISPPRGRPTSVSESRISVMDRIAEISRLLELKTGNASAAKVERGNALRSFFKDPRPAKPLDNPPVPQPPPVATQPSMSPSPPDVDAASPLLDSREVSISPYQPQVHNVPVQYIQHMNPVGYGNPSFPIVQNYPHPPNVIHQPLAPTPIVPPPITSTPMAPIPAPVVSSGGMISLHNPYGVQVVQPPPTAAEAEPPTEVEETTQQSQKKTNGTKSSEQVQVEQVAPSSPSKSEIQTSPPKSDVPESPRSSKKSPKSSDKKTRVFPPAATNLSEDLQEKLKQLDADDDGPPKFLETCQNCESRTTGAFCVQCDGFLCDECATQIHRNKLFKNHVVSKVSQMNQPQLDSLTLNNMFVPPVQVESEGESSSPQDTPKLLSATAEKLREFENTKSPELEASDSQVKEVTPVQAEPEPEPLKPLDEVLETMFITINDMKQRAESPQPDSPVQPTTESTLTNAKNSFKPSPDRPLPESKPVPAPPPEPQQPPNFPSDISQVFHQLASIVEQFAQSPGGRTPHEKRPPTPRRTMQSLRKELEGGGSPFGSVPNPKPGPVSTPRTRGSADILGNSPLLPTTLYSRERRTVSPDRPYEGGGDGFPPLAL